MKQRPRSRGRGGSASNRGPNRGPNRGGAVDSNGPEVRVRGTAQQVCEKYLALARDASSMGDRVLAENYFQHADHYFRIAHANEMNRPQRERDNGQGGERPERFDANGDGGQDNGQDSRRYGGRGDGFGGHDDDGDDDEVVVERQGATIKQMSSQRHDGGATADEADDGEADGARDQGNRAAVADDDAPAAPRAPRRRARKPQSKGTDKSDDKTGDDVGNTEPISI